MSNITYEKLRADWEIFQGDYVDQLIRLGTKSKPISNIGKTYRLMVKRRASDPASKAVIYATTENNGIVLDGADGLRVRIEASVTAALDMPKAKAGVAPVLDCVYDLEEISLGKPRKILVGKFTIIGEVTN